jgi:hypothetical protein
MRFVIAFFVMILVAAPVQAFDATGNNGTVGAESCGTYVEAREEKGIHNLVFQGWVAAYITAANAWIGGKNDWLGSS